MHGTTTLEEPARIVVKPMLADLSADDLTRINCLCFGLVRGCRRRSRGGDSASRSTDADHAQRGRRGEGEDDRRREPELLAEAWRPGARLQSVRQRGIVGRWLGV